MAHLERLMGDYYTIYKYVLGQGGSTRVVEVELPLAAKLLSVKMQRDKITLWAAVDPEVRKVIRRFWILGTGWPIPKGIALEPLDTVLDPRGYVWHIFVEVVI